MANFIKLLRLVYTSARRNYYSRIVFNDVNTDMRHIVLGPDVCRNFHIVHPQHLSIGVGTVLNGDCYINAQGGVKIGSHCHIGKGLTLLSSNHNFRSENAIPYDENDILKPVEIGDAVWIGANVSISPGSRIGDGAIIALGAIVRGEVRACAIVAGNPAQVVGWRDSEIFKHLQQQGAFA